MNKVYVKDDEEEDVVILKFRLFTFITFFFVKIVQMSACVRNVFIVIGRV